MQRPAAWRRLAASLSAWQPALMAPQRRVMLLLLPLLRWSASVAMFSSSSIAAGTGGAGTAGEATTTITIPYTILPGGGKLPMLVMGDGVGWGRGTCVRSP